MTHNGLKVTREKDKNGEDIIFKTQLYIQNRYSDSKHYNNLIVVIEPMYFGYEKSPEKYSAFRIYNVSEGKEYELFTCLHQLDPVKGNVKRCIEDIIKDDPISGIKACQVLGLDFEITITGE